MTDHPPKSPYREPADIAADMPTSPKPWKWPSRTGLVLRFLGAAACAVGVGVLYDLDSHLTCHGTLWALRAVLVAAIVACLISILVEFA